MVLLAAGKKQFLSTRLVEVFCAAIHALRQSYICPLFLFGWAQIQSKIVYPKPT